MIRFFTAGESHGPGLVIIVEGIPAGLPLDEEYIASQLGRRQRGYGRGGRMLIEQDHAIVTSGVRHGRTLGSPIGMTMENKDWVNWQQSMSIGTIEQNPDYDPEDTRSRRVTRIRPGPVSYTHLTLPTNREV